MSNSTSRFSLSKNNGPNQSDPHNNNNNQLKKSESVKQDIRVNLYALTLPRSISGDNLHSLLSSLTPLVAVKFSSKPKIEGSSIESEGKPYFVLEDMWESYNEWSAIGVEVPFKQIDHETVAQYFAPSLSALQLYVEDDQGLKKSSEEKSGLEPSKKTTTKLVYQFFEDERPHERMHLINKVSILAEERPYIKTYRSSDISPCSWFSVAWYPIYGIRTKPTLKNIKAAFLTFHNLSAHFESKNQPKLHDGDGPLKMPLPIFGLTTDKLKRSILAFPKARESTQLNTLLKAADDWLDSLNVVSHYDHNHFVRHGKQWVEEKKDK